MLEGWYCRSIANEAAAAEQEERMQEESKFKKEYRFLKRKFQHLVYENEAFQQALRLAQKRLLAVTKDRTFLLDRLLMHEKIDNSTSESDNTDSSDDGDSKPELIKKKRTDHAVTNNVNSNSGKVTNAKRKRIPTVSKQQKQIISTVSQQLPSVAANIISDGHMTPEEVERHLQSQSFLELVPERAPPTVPTEMFSNEPSLDSESNDVGELETSPSNVGDEVNIDMATE